MPTEFTGYPMGNLVFGIKIGLDVQPIRAGITLFGTLSTVKIKNPFDSYNSIMSVAYYKDKE